MYLPGKAQFNGLVASVAGASIRSLAVDPSGKRVAVASECVLIYANPSVHSDRARVF